MPYLKGCRADGGYPIEPIRNGFVAPTGGFSPRYYGFDLLTQTYTNLRVGINEDHLDACGIPPKSICKITTIDRMPLRPYALSDQMTIVPITPGEPEYNLSPNGEFVLPSIPPFDRLKRSETIALNRVPFENSQINNNLGQAIAEILSRQRV